MKKNLCLICYFVQVVVEFGKYKSNFFKFEENTEMKKKNIDSELFKK